MFQAVRGQFVFCDFVLAKSVFPVSQQSGRLSSLTHKIIIYRGVYREAPGFAQSANEYKYIYIYIYLSQIIQK